VRETIYRLEPDQVRRLRWLGLGFLVLTALLIVASVATGGPWWIVSVFSGIFGIWFTVSWLALRGAYTRVDDWGIRVRGFAGSRRETAWAEVDDIAIRRTDRNESIHVDLRSGAALPLAAPVHSTLLPDLAFHRKFEQISEAWLFARAEGR
jgi:hypothetical protein